MSTAKDGEKYEYVGTVRRRRCRHYLEKIFKENLKGGEVYEFSCSWLTGFTITRSPLSPPMLEELDHDNNDTEDTTGGYSSFLKKVLWQNTKGGVLHEFSHNWLTGSHLTPVAFSPKTDKGNNANKLLPTEDGYRRMFAYVILENLKGGILHEYSHGRLTGAKLTPILPEQWPLPIHYDHRIFYFLKTGLLCQHFSMPVGVFNRLDRKIVIQPYRVSPEGDDDHQHQTGPLKDYPTEI